MDRLLQVTPAIWNPLAGPQLEAYLSEADELFYGGQAGGGKTDLAIGLSLTAHQKSIIFRREFPMIKGIEDRATEILGSRAGYNANEKMWRLGNGRSMEFGAVQYLEDREKYQGRPHDLKVFDEITHFLLLQYLFLIGWNRSAKPGQRSRVLATGNPPTSPEGEWVIDYWGPWLDDENPAYPTKPGELLYFAMLDGKSTLVGPDPIKFKGELITPKSRSFIPARVEDNPFLMATGYKAILQGLPEPLRTQMLQGVFKIKQADDPWQVIPTRWVELAMERWKTREQPKVPITGTGVDVARGGDDKTVIAPRYLNWIAPPHKFEGSETPDGPTAAGLVVNITGGHGYINVDIIGVGGSCYDSLVMANQPVYPLNGAAASAATDRTGRLGFVNKRAEWHWRMRELLDPDFGEDVALPPDRELKADLCAPRWKLTARGIQVEAKEEIKKRIGRSPDVGEAVIYSCVLPEDPGGVVTHDDPVIISPY